MSAIIMDGKKVAEAIKATVSDYIANTGEEISLTIYQVGDDPASNTYIRNKVKACADVGMKSEVVKLGTEDYDRYQLLPKYLREDTADGVMLQLPLPEGWDERYFVDQIFASSDADCLTTIQQGMFYSKNTPYISPCTAQAVIDFLVAYKIPIEGKHAVVVGRSNIVGKPVSKLLLDRNATVTTCHSKTNNLSEITRQADILVVAIGKPNFITTDMVKPGAVVIDVGINRNEDNKLCGDVDFESVKEVASYITPVPGGVGPVTVANLLFNTLKLHIIKQEGKNIGK